MNGRDLTLGVVGALAVAGLVTSRCVGSRATVKEASGWIGQSVYVWTAINGEYIGVLEEVFGSPWRGKVRVTSVVKPVGFTYDRADRPRTGFEIGEHIEAGGSSIRLQPAPDQPLTYLDALRRDLDGLRRLTAGAEGSKHFNSLLWSITQTEKEIIFRERVAAMPARLVREVIRIGTKQRADETPSQELESFGFAMASRWGPKLTQEGWRAYNILTKAHPAVAAQQVAAVPPPPVSQRPRLGIFAAAPAPETVPAPAPEPVPQPQAPRRPVLLSDFIKKRGSSNEHPWWAFSRWQSSDYTDKAAARTLSAIMGWDVAKRYAEPMTDPAVWDDEIEGRILARYGHPQGSGNKKPSAATLRAVGRYVKSTNPDEVEYAKEAGYGTGDLAMGEYTYSIYGDGESWQELVSHIKASGRR